MGFVKTRLIRARSRAQERELPFNLDSDHLYSLFAQQGGACAVSRIIFQSPGATEEQHKNPFGPSLDRIIPKLGYVKGNVRWVANMVNFAMNVYGEAPFIQLCRTVSKIYG